MMRIVVCDLDYTLCNTSSLGLFYRYLVSRGCVSISNRIFIFLRYIFFRMGIVSSSMLKERVLKALKGRSQDELNRLAKCFVSSVSLNNFRSEILEYLKREKEKGARIVLLTGAFSFYSNEIGMHFLFDNVFATDVDFKDGVCCGREKKGNINCFYPGTFCQL